MSPALVPASRFSTKPKAPSESSCAETTMRPAKARSLAEGFTALVARSFQELEGKPFPSAPGPT